MKGMRGLGKVISISNQKGGVGKTTTSLNLTTALNKLGKKVLLLDLDPQSSLTIAIGLEPENVTYSLYNALIQDVDIKKLILKDEAGLFHFVPGSLDLSIAEQELITVIGRESKVKDALDPVINDYDFVVIDCPPSLGLLTINALVASDYVIAPTSPEYLAIRGFNLLEQTMAKIKKLNRNIELLGILFTLYDNRTTHHKDAVAEMKKSYPVFNQFIKRSVKFPDSMAAGLPIQEFDGNFEGALAYDKLAEEVIEWVVSKNPS